MRGLDILGASLFTHLAPPRLTPPPAPPSAHAAPSSLPSAPPSAHVAPSSLPSAPPSAHVAPPSLPAAPSARATASAQKAQAAGNRAIAAGQKLSRHNSKAGQKLIATGNAHNTRAQALLHGGSVAAHHMLGAQGPDPGVVDSQTDAVNAVAQLGEQANQMLDWVQTLQTSGPQAALHQAVQAQRAAL